MSTEFIGLRGWRMVARSHGCEGSILESVDIEPLTEALAKLAGEALAAVAGATLVDAIVMASAATRGAIVYSCDVEDLERLRRRLPSVRVLRV